jgi:hypothetical protein
MRRVDVANPCLGGENQPHKIESLRIDEGVDPSSKQVVGAYKVVCVKCGAGLEEITGPKKATRRPRKPKSVSGSEVDTNSLD